MAKFDDIKDLDALLAFLQKIRAKEGNINVCYSHPDEYWGSTQGYFIEDYNLLVENAQPDGPKSGKSCKCVIFGN